MSYVWSQERIDTYFGYYPLIDTRHTISYVNYATTSEFARSVLPPCLEPAEQPTITISFMAFFEVIGGIANREGRDRAALISINARRGQREGVYYLTVLETEEVNIVTGRELWGMPKKLGTIDFFDDGRSLFAFGERRGHRLIELEADLGLETHSDEIESELYFELRGYFDSTGGVTNTQLLTFENRTAINRSRELTNPKVTLKGSPFDSGPDTIPLGDFTGGAAVGGETSYEILDTADLDDDGNDYAPYLLGRLYDDWPDLRAPGRVPMKLRLEKGRS
ncbi:hypothetical protein CIW52_11170 [Mycolicibacterium sp. P9-64]|uniref:acetoacetate decarboxylase family protein n=1 Tax=Mycolicibacterium sp. P9-64 TaxID=2024612 RepID=UPI0011EFD4AB|nr:acetoacetate decarboxylase family protein [Mycolicibacterium sp. P9-64]KAA0084553.1 hypothetical protein CIW52_11170 [Mycolicibacterium sp. P9-64]